MSNAQLANGFSDLEVPVVDGGTNDSNTMSLSFNGIDQGAKGLIDVPGVGTGALTAWVKVNDASRADTFRLRPRASGYKNLPVALTIDGVTVQPSIRLEADNADLTSWDDVINSNAFTPLGSGNDPTFDEKAPGLLDKRVKFNAGKGYEAGTSSIGAIGTDDFVIEIVFTADDTGTPYIFSKIGSAGVAESVILYQLTGTVRLYINSAAGALIDGVIGSGLVNGLTYHVIVFVDRTNNMRGYVNGVAGTAYSVSAHAASDLAAASKWTVGLRGYSATNNFNGGVSYIAFWRYPNWLNTPDAASIAAKRFAQCCGVYAETAQPLNPGFLDLDFELAGTANWTAASGALLSKQSGTRTGGNGTQVLRITGDGVTSTPRALQTKVGGITRVTGWARSGTGAVQPAVYLAGNELWFGSLSTSWQYFDVSVRGSWSSLNRIDVGFTGVSSSYVEFDDITIEVDGAIPSATTRATQAYLEKWNAAETEAYLIPVGPGWMRTDKVKAADSSFKIGARLEHGQTNRFLYSEDFSNAAWTKTRATIGTPITALGNINFDAIVASSDNNTHPVQQGVVTAAGEDHAVTIHAKASGVSSIKIELNEDATQYAYFNLSTGAVGDVGAGFTLSNPAQIYDKGNGVYRCEIRPNTPGATGTINIYPSDGSTVGSETFTGNGSTVSVYLGAAQFEREQGSSQQSGSLTSYIKTTSATASRNADVLTYYGYENVGGRYAQNVHYKVDYLCPVYASDYLGYRLFGALSNKTTNERIELFRNSATDKIHTLVTAGGVAQAEVITTSSAVFDNNKQTIEYCAAKNNVNAIFNRVVEGTDTSAAMPDMLEIVVGANSAYAFHIDGLITDLQISPYGTVYPRAIMGLEKTYDGKNAFVAYDQLDDDATTYELRAGAGATRGVTMNGGTLNAGQWYLISLEWVAGTGMSLKVDGVEVGTATADSSIAALDTLILAWLGLVGYTYEPSPSQEDYPVTYGGVSIADVQTHWVAPGAAWYAEMLARGVPAKHEDLIHQISQVAFDGTGHYDFLTGTAGSLTTEGTPGSLPPTEIGLPLGTDSGNNSIIDFGSSFAFMQAASHSYDAWIRVDGGGDQCIWANGDENSTDFQALLYDDATNSLVYKCVVGATLRSVSAEIETDRLYHVAITRDYDSGAGTTEIRIYIDGEIAEIQSYSGAPVVTNDNFVMLSTSEAGGVFTRPFAGATAGNRFYDDALALSEIEAIYAADSAVILNGPYATQTITPATKPATISGAVKASGSGGYPIVLVQEEDGGAWRSIASTDSFGSFETFSRQQPVNAIRLYTKNYAPGLEQTSYFDDLDGGEDPGESAIALVEVAKNKRKALENLVLARKPLHSWAVMVVKYV